jgi:hypothetical protein
MIFPGSKYGSKFCKRAQSGYDYLEEVEDE